MSERFVTVTALPCPLAAAGSPVMLTQAQLLRDTQEGNYMIRLGMQNTSSQTLRSIILQLTLRDPLENPLEGVYEQRFDGLQVAPEAEFEEMIVLADPGVAVGGFAVNVTQAGFDSGEYAVRCAAFTPVAKSKKKKGKGWLLILVLLLLLAAGVAGVYFFGPFGASQECTDHEWRNATCEDPKTCAICGKTTGKAKGHDWQEANCEDPETCAVCGETQGEPGEHHWLAATCEAPETCEICGETRGEPGEHQWSQADYDTASTCAVCGESSGRSLGYPLGWCAMVDSSNEPGGSGKDAYVGDFYDTRGVLHTDAVKFWTIQRAGWSDTEYAVFDLGGKYQSLELTVCAAQENETGGTTKILVYADGELIYESGWVGNEAVSVALDVTGVRKLKIEATTDSEVFCHCLCNGVLYAVAD